MPSSLNTTNITPPRVPIIDERTGLISREWYRFFLNLFVLTGNGSNQVSLSELQMGPPPLQIDSISKEDNVSPVTSSDLVSQYAEMQKQIDGIEETPSNDYLQANYTELKKQVNGIESSPQPQLGTLSGVNIDWVPYLGFDTAPSWIGTTAGQFWFDSTTGSFNAKMGNNNITQQIGEEFFRYGKASATISDTNLQLVYKTGVVGASGVITFAPTVAGITDPDQILGIATEPIALNGFGRITTAGVVHGVNTTGSVYGEVWADNDDIWYNPVTGGLTKTKPVAPNIKLQIGTVINAGSGGSGSFSVKIGSSSALGGTDSNVELGTLYDADLLQYNTAQQRWENVPASTVQMLSWIEA